MALHHSIMVLWYKIPIFEVNFNFEELKYYLWLLGSPPVGYVKLMSEPKEKGQFHLLLSLLL